MEFSDYRDGSFYYINDLEKMNHYVLNIIGGLRTTSYKNFNVNITSSFPIDKFYEFEKLSNTTYKKNTKQTLFNILQFIAGHEYTYVLELQLPENIKVDDNILNITVNYTDFCGNTYKVNKTINYNYGCIKCYRKEYCRILAVEALEKALSQQYQRQILFDEVKTKCGDDLDKDISKAFDEIPSESGKPYIYGIISEISLKRGGINLSYSNKYQNELIDNYLGKKY